MRVDGLRKLPDQRQKLRNFCIGQLLLCPTVVYLHLSPAQVTASILVRNLFGLQMASLRFRAQTELERLPRINRSADGTRPSRPAKGLRQDAIHGIRHGKAQ